jgi:sodium-independent sulfate anion transporter 11
MPHSKLYGFLHKEWIKIGSILPKVDPYFLIYSSYIFLEDTIIIYNCSCFSELDLIPAFATFLSCLFIRLELGIVIGIGINVLFLLYASARPSVRVEKAVVSIS